MELYRIFKCFTRKKFTFYVYFNFNQGYCKDISYEVIEGPFIRVHKVVSTTDYRSRDFI